MKLKFIEIQQPIGTFYLTSIPADQLIDNVKISRRKDNIERGVQRDLDKARVSAISKFCADPDAMFPTPIVISVSEGVPYSMDKSTNTLFIPDGVNIGYVIDGQHRIEGLRESGLADRFMLPVVLMFGLTDEEMAFVFSTINSTQKSVSMSLIYDLFDLSKLRSPYKTAHYVARSLNNKPSSPFHNRLKMLGRKTPDQPYATLSQGTFVNALVKNLSTNASDDLRALRTGQQLNDNEKLPMRKFFIENKDEIILRILENCFLALREVFPNEWTYANSSVLWKTTGFCGIMMALNNIMRVGLAEKTLDKEYFTQVFKGFREYLQQKDLTLTSKDFPGGGQQNQRKFANLILASIEERQRAAQVTSHLETNYKTFVDEIIGDLEFEEKYELCNALYSGTEALCNCFTCEADSASEDTLLITYIPADLTLRITIEQCKECLNWIETKYFDGLDYESWYSIEYCMSKDD